MTCSSCVWETPHIIAFSSLSYSYFLSEAKAETSLKRATFWTLCVTVSVLCSCVQLCESYTWGRAKDLVKKTKLRNQSKLRLSSTSLKMSCPQLSMWEITMQDAKLCLLIQKVGHLICTVYFKKKENKKCNDRRVHTIVICDKIYIMLDILTQSFLLFLI